MRRRRRKKSKVIVSVLFLLGYFIFLSPYAVGVIITLISIILIFITSAINFNRGTNTSTGHGSRYSSGYEPNKVVESEWSYEPNKVVESEWSIDLIKLLEWKRFEELCSAYFKGKGYRAEVTRLGADGGIDIFLYKDSHSLSLPMGVVQCKAWNNYKVGVKPIRELFGVMHAENAKFGIFVTSGEYTKEAIRFSQNKKLVLFTGDLLLKKILNLPEKSQQQLLKYITNGDYTTPSCPACGVKMTLRTSKTGKNVGNQFWGCPKYPKCRKILQLKAV